MDSFALVNDKAVREIIDHEWKDGNFSEKIWSNTDELAREVKQVLLEGELTGASEAKMAAKIEERFHVGMYKARRVIRTESNYCINQAELKGMKDAGFDEYEFISLGENAENVCDTCDNLDGERFKIADAVVGVNCPPMHPFCRCKVTTPLRTEADIQADIDRLLNGMSMEELANRLEALAEKREALPESDSTLNSAEENSQKMLTGGENGGIIETNKEPDFYTGMNGKTISKDYKDWIGDNKMDFYLSQAQSDIVKTYIRSDFRKSSFIGDGSTAAIRKFEIETGLKCGRNGNDHSQKVSDLINQINKGLTHDISAGDKSMLEEMRLRLEEVK